MKKEQKKELRSKTADELIKELRDLRAETAKMKFDMKSGKVENFNAFYRKKKDIARVLTYLSEKSMSEKSSETAKTVEK